jgi:hypothetical protein
MCVHAHNIYNSSKSTVVLFPCLKMSNYCTYVLVDTYNHKLDVDECLYPELKALYPPAYWNGCVESGRNIPQYSSNLEINMFFNRKCVMLSVFVEQKSGYNRAHGTVRG